MEEHENESCFIIPSSLPNMTKKKFTNCYTNLSREFKTETHFFQQVFRRDFLAQKTFLLNLQLQWLLKKFFKLLSLRYISTHVLEYVAAVLVYGIWNKKNYTRRKSKIKMNLYRKWRANENKLFGCCPLRQLPNCCNTTASSGLIQFSHLLTTKT